MEIVYASHENEITVRCETLRAHITTDVEFRVQELLLKLVIAHIREPLPEKFVLEEDEYLIAAGMSAILLGVCALADSAPIRSA